MKRTSIKNLLIALTIIVTLLLVVSNSAYAAGEILNPFQVNQTSDNGTTTTNTVTTNTVTTNTTTVNTVTANTTTSTNTNLPQTGDASDYIIFTFIAIASVVAIYAYRKVKNYNI